MTVKQLKAEAKGRALRGYSKLRKAELLSLLCTVRELLEMAKQANIAGRWRMRKRELCEALGGRHVHRRQESASVSGQDRLREGHRRQDVVRAGCEVSSHHDKPRDHDVQTMSQGDRESIIVETLAGLSMTDAERRAFRKLFAGHPDAKYDTVLRARELRAIAFLRDGADTEAGRKDWANEYVRRQAGI